ncbi:MAG: 50S ribosomal protein L10 [Krumholzibacteria bacterium]|nr:50S ribosomal protein L10 [Candidatus Krumholzibacteria bacterium]
MARPEKEAEVLAIAERLEQAQSVVLANYSGLTVAQMTQFRRNCRARSVECRVVKNRLARIAAEKVGAGVLKDALKGPTAIVFGAESQVEPAKLVVEFAKDNDRMQIKGGYVDGQILDANQVVALARTPSREELLSMMMGSISSPARGLACTVNGVAAALARVVDAAAKAKAAA